MKKFKDVLNEHLAKVKDKDGNLKWAVLSKTTNKPLQYYNGEGVPDDKWVSGVEKRIQYFKHLK